jgi:hypothetical protein
VDVQTGGFVEATIGFAEIGSIGCPGAAIGVIGVIGVIFSEVT